MADQNGAQGEDTASGSSYLGSAGFSLRSMHRTAVSMCERLGAQEGGTSSKNLLVKAAYEGDMRTVRKIYSKEIGDSELDELWRLAVDAARMVAACAGNLRILEYLGGGELEEETASSLLFHALVFERTEVTKALLDAGGNPNDGMESDSEPSLLHMAAYVGNAENVKALLAAGADGQAEYKGESALVMAVRQSQAESTRDYLGQFDRSEVIALLRSVGAQGNR